MRKTALFLVAAIIFGGAAILFGYLNHVSKQEWRPAFVDELMGQIKFRLADGTVVNTSEIKEDIWLLMQSSVDAEGTHEEREKALAAIPSEGIRRLVFYVDVDPNNEDDMRRMAALPVEKDTWRIAANAEVLRRWLRTEVRFGLMPKETENGWYYDTSVIVVKRDWTSPDKPRMHVRGERFDFDQAKKSATEGGKPELADGYRDDWFVKTVNYLLTEKDPTKNDT